MNKLLLSTIAILSIGGVAYSNPFASKAGSFIVDSSKMAIVLGVGQYIGNMPMVNSIENLSTNVSSLHKIVDPMAQEFATIPEGYTGLLAARGLNFLKPDTGLFGLWSSSKKVFNELSSALAMISILCQIKKTLSEISNNYLDGYEQRTIQSQKQTEKDKERQQLQEGRGRRS